MFRNYLVTALRNIARHRLYSFINIAGLAVGLACVIFVLLFIRDELSYDKWIPDTQNLYQIEASSVIPGRDVVMAKFFVERFQVGSLGDEHLIPFRARGAGTKTVFRHARGRF